LDDPPGVGRVDPVPAPWTAVLVHGPSMVPALYHGDALLVRRGGPVRAGDLVVAVFPGRPDLLVVKRAVRPVDGGWWLESDNPAVADDSRRYGPAAVRGRAVFRYWPPSRFGPVGRFGPPRSRRPPAPGPGAGPVR
jgi:phage repressor protein C with HTH and peptisase S24 domain